MRRTLTRAIAAALLVAYGFAFAQASLPDAAASALAEGEAAMAEALVTYEAQYPDRPLWQRAFAAGRRAASLAPERLEPVRFLAEAYSRSQWTGPAWTAWQDYLARGGVLDDEGRALAADVGVRLAFGLYEQGRTDEALDRYIAVTELAPDVAEAHVWAGRILIETERPAQAIAYWRRAAELEPSDERAAYFLAFAQEQARWGSRAVDAFRAGVASYEQGLLSEAAERFARASTLNPEYPEAWAWLGRTAFERGAFEDAALYYATAARLVPDDDTYAYWRAESQRRAAGEAAPAVEGDAEDGAAGE
ncbi:MAG: tetratricopeptide repeat protein [Trueperaceae bacterium]|nr:tetratricopeptide repeat protein [Trueperaceae bacterium]